MMVMIDPSNVRGAFTGGQPAQPQGTQADPAQPAPNNVSQPAQDSTNSDALAALESLVAESAQVTPQQSQQQPQPPQPTSVQTPAQSQPDPQPPQPQPTQAPVDTQAQQQSVQPQSQSVPQDQSDQLEQVPADVNAQAMLSTIQATPDPLNPPNPAPASAKEVFERPAAPDAASVDVGGAVQHVEVEKNPEIPTEVEGFLQRVEDFSAKPPQEVVIADGTNEQATANYPSRPVIVLPITQEEEKKGKNKSPRNSIRWLVEWSHKIVKMFAGKVIYRQVEEE